MFYLNNLLYAKAYVTISRRFKYQKNQFVNNDDIFRCTLKMNNNSEKIKERLVTVLKSHPEGLTITELARIMDSHRQTVTKYILVLEALGEVHRRRIGAVTLHYLKNEWLRLIK